MPNQSLAELQEQFPELNTPLYERFIEQDESDGRGALSCVDITRTVRDMEIRTEYPGEDREKRNISIYGDELLGDNHIYLLNGEEDEASLILLSNQKFKTVDDVKKRLGEDTYDDRIPCYFDIETGILVISIEAYWAERKIHHGVTADSHRETYKGVIITRSLAVMSENHEAVIKDPKEFEDLYIVSANIIKRGGQLLIDISSKDVNPKLANVLAELGIVTLDKYIEELSRKPATNDRLKVLLGLANVESDESAISTFLSATFQHHYKQAYMNEDRTNVLFSPGMFISENLEYPSFSPDFNSYRSMNKGDYNLYSQLLMHNEPVPVSIMVYKNLWGDLLFTVSQNHPDADRFFRSIAKPGFIGYSDAQSYCQLDGNLQIEMERIETGKQLKQLITGTTIGNGKYVLPLKIKVESGRLGGLTDNGAPAEIDIEKVVDDFNNRDRAFSDPKKVIFYT